METIILDNLLLASYKGVIFVLPVNGLANHGQSLFNLVTPEVDHILQAFEVVDEFIVLHARLVPAFLANSVSSKMQIWAFQK